MTSEFQTTPPKTYTLKAAVAKKPVCGWDCRLDLDKAEECLEEAARVDKIGIFFADHIRKLYDLGIHPATALNLLKQYWPNDPRHGLEKSHKERTTAAILRHYVDTPYPAGRDATGRDESDDEEQSDGTWLKKWDNHKFSKLKPWQWIADSNQFVHDDGLLRYSDKQFERLMGKLTKKSLMTAINRADAPMKKFAAQVYVPKQPPIIRYEGRTVFNLWRESSMQPQFGDVDWFLDHVAFMFPADSDRRHLLDYMAQLIQHPEQKIHFAMLLQSTEGAGKGALAKILKRIIGKRNVVEPSNDEILKTFTGWQEGAQLAIINELMADGRPEVLNRLKSPITEDTLRIEKKFGNTFTIPNHMNLFCMTNFKNALSLTEGDRRWLILYSPALKRPAEYYGRLFRYIDHDDSAVAAVMDFLLGWKIGFNPKAPAPWTEAKADMQQRARSDADADLQSIYDAGGWPFNHPLVRADDLTAALRMDHKNIQHAHRAAYAFLDHIKAVKLKRYRSARAVDGLPAHQLYAIRDHAKWQAAKPVDVARAYHEQAELSDNDAG